MSASPQFYVAGAGRIQVDPTDGAPLQFIDPAGSARRFLLDEAADDVHSPEHRWAPGS